MRIIEFNYTKAPIHGLQLNQSKRLGFTAPIINCYYCCFCRQIKNIVRVSGEGAYPVFAPPPPLGVPTGAQNSCCELRSSFSARALYETLDGVHATRHKFFTRIQSKPNRWARKELTGNGFSRTAAVPRGKEGEVDFPHKCCPRSISCSPLFW